MVFSVQLHLHQMSQWGSLLQPVHVQMVGQQDDF
jgi:hypothetical protein